FHNTVRNVLHITNLLVNKFISAENRYASAKVQVQHTPFEAELNIRQGTDRQRCVIPEILIKA
ncbi:MAG: hypothetical protein OEV34_04425, partial [Gammaproteobacteria bacterium]|nr:hypothetical protein [Gammaproteobacteria bacterium]